MIDSSLSGVLLAKCAQVIQRCKKDVRASYLLIKQGRGKEKDETQNGIYKKEDKNEFETFGD